MNNLFFILVLLVVASALTLLVLTYRIGTQKKAFNNEISPKIVKHNMTRNPLILAFLIYAVVMVIILILAYFYFDFFGY